MLSLHVATISMIVHCFDSEGFVSYETFCNWRRASWLKRRTLTEIVAMCKLNITLVLCIP